MLNQTRLTYFSPEDDTQGAFLEFLSGARASVRIADYAFNLGPVVDLLIAQHASGIDGALIVDLSQSQMANEKKALARLKAVAYPFVVGTSSRHKIMHAKFAVRDREWVSSGSWNYTSAASDENNHLDIENNATRAEWFAGCWQRMHDWIVANEPQPTLVELGLA